MRWEAFHSDARSWLCPFGSTGRSKRHRKGTRERESKCYNSQGEVELYFVHYSLTWNCTGFVRLFDGLKRAWRMKLGSNALALECEREGRSPSSLFVDSIDGLNITGRQTWWGRARTGFYPFFRILFEGRVSLIFVEGLRAEEDDCWRLTYTQCPSSERLWYLSTARLASSALA